MGIIWGRLTLSLSPSGEFYVNSPEWISGSFMRLETHNLQSSFLSMTNALIINSFSSSNTLGWVAQGQSKS